MSTQDPTQGRPRGSALLATEQSLPIALLRLREAVMERYRPLLLAQDITEQQWRVLRVLEERGPMDAGAVAELACILAPSLSRITRALSARRLLTATRDPADGRRTILDITPEGIALIEKIAPASQRATEEIAAALGPEAKRELMRALITAQRALAQTACE